jgi:protein phosphatase 2C family protein 2/3
LLPESSAENGKLFVPTFRSGSCAEIGPKQNMEDEHICIDNLVEHLSPDCEFPSPSAFYGVSIIIFLALSSQIVCL